VFAWIVVKILLQECCLMVEFVDQLNPCVLVIRPSFVLQAFFLKIEYLGTSFIFKMFYGLKIGAKTYFKTRSLPKLVFIKTTGI
jgi:hypothetical protein